MIRPFPEVLRDLAAPAHRWLMLGKGPSFSRYAELGAGGRRICALNHVAAETDCDLAHVADIDVIEDCGEAIAERAQFLLMPWRPHIAFNPSPIPLDELALKFPPLRRLSESGRLLCYNLSTAVGMPAHPKAPWIEACMFGGPVAASALAMSGALEIRTLGVDGGARYAQAFNHLADTTLLSNGAPSFDVQFSRFAALGRERGLMWGPLYAPMPIRVAISVPRGLRLAAALLAVTLEDHASGAVVTHFIDPATRSEEPSALAAGAGGKGRVIHLLPELLALGDLLELWTAEMDGAPALADPSGAATLIDASHPDLRDLGAKTLAIGTLPSSTTSPPRPVEQAPTTPVLLDFRGASPLPWQNGGGAELGGRLWRDELRRALASSRLPPELLLNALQSGEVGKDLVAELHLKLQGGGTGFLRFCQAVRRTAKKPPSGWYSRLGRRLRRAVWFAQEVFMECLHRRAGASSRRSHKQ